MMVGSDVESVFDPMPDDRAGCGASLVASLLRDTAQLTSTDNLYEKT